PLRWLVGLFLGAGVVAFAVTQTQNWRIGVGFAVGLGIVFALLAATARLLILAARKIRLAGMPFTVRQGIANLHRPNNRTLLLLLSLGLGTFLIMTLLLTRSTLLGKIASIGGGERSNLMFFDIQEDQV